MTTVIRCGRLIDGTDRGPIEDALLVLDGERIGAVGPVGALQPPPGAELIDLGGRTVLPGLIDSHTHLMLNFGDDPNEQHPQPELYGMLKCVRHMRQDLRCGITTIRNLSERSFRAVAVRQAVAQGLIPGPRIYTGVRGIRATHGWGQNAFGFDGVEALRRAIRENVEAGADLIKIYVTGENFRDTATRCYLTREEVQACVDEAHRAGLRIAAHAHGGEGLRHCLEAGVDTIEHGTRITEDDIELFLKHGATLVATFNPYMRPTTLAAGRPPEFVAGVTRAQENIRRVFPAFFRSGAKFTAGSDSSHGNFVFEVEMLVELGLTPLQAISACTRQAADALGILDRAGTLEPGKWADVIAVRGNPLEDVSALREVEFVMMAGVRMELSPL